METLNDEWYADMKEEGNFNIKHTYVENQLKVELIDLRSGSNRYYAHIVEVHLASYEELLTDKWKGINLTKDDITSMNQVIILTKTTLIQLTDLGEYIYYTTLALHTTKI